MSKKRNKVGKPMGKLNNLVRKIGGKCDDAATMTTTVGVSALIGAALGTAVGCPIIGAGVGAVCGEQLAKDAIKEKNSKKEGGSR